MPFKTKTMPFKTKTMPFKTKSLGSKVARSDKSSKVQAVVFIKNNKSEWNITKARKWLREHNFKSIKPPDKRGSEIRFRIVNPQRFKSFSTKKLKNNVNLILGFT